MKLHRVGDEPVVGRVGDEPVVVMLAAERHGTIELAARREHAADLLGSFAGTAEPLTRREASASM